MCLPGALEARNTGAEASRRSEAETVVEAEGKRLSDRPG